MRTKLNSEVKLIPNSNIRALVENVLIACPECFWLMPAATSGKYHPAISLGEGGLVRHTKAVVRITQHLLDLAGVTPEDGCKNYSLAIAGAILHDVCKKSDKERYTAFEHPLRAASLIREQAKWTNENLIDVAYVDPDTVEKLCAIVSSHMGRWSTDEKHHPGVKLPTPAKALERLVHTADFIASRKDITIAGIV